MAMQKTRRILCWIGLLWKRLYKKLTFVLLLVLIPALVFGYGQTTQEESGLVTVALASRVDPVEPLTQAVWDDLLQSQIVRYIVCDSPEEARELVLNGQADTAWIFEADIERGIYDFVARRSRNQAFITVLEPENRVALKLVRELLSGVMFPHCAKTVYLSYIRENAPELDHLSDQQLMEYYDNAMFDDELFIFSDMDGNVQEPVEEPTSYLLTPVRGMLGVVAVLAGLATAMYYIRDEKSGTFAWVPLGRRGIVELGCQLISLVNVVAVALISLALTGQTGHLGRELLVAVLYSLCVAGFAMAVRRISGGIRGLGMATPLLVVVMLAVCPVFFDLGAMRQLQYCFPPTYFVNATYNDRYIGLMILYTLAMLAICGVTDLCKLRFSRHCA